MLLIHYKLRNATSRQSQPKRRLWLLFFFVIGLTSAFQRLCADPLIVNGQGSVALLEHMEPTPPPSALFNRSGLKDDNDSWYKIELQKSELNTSAMVIRFRQVPFQQLDFFAPTSSGYQLYKLGTGSSQNHHIVKLNLSSEQSSIFYIRYHSLNPNRLAPELWPEDVLLAKTDSYNLVLSSLQLLLLTILIGVFFQHFRHQSSASYLMIAHTMAASVLLILWQGDIFQITPWLGDPGHWVAITTMVTLVVALASYRHLTALATYAPLLDKLILGTCTLALAMVIYYFSNAGQLPPVILETALQTLAIGYGLVIIGALHCLYNGSHPARSTVIIATATLLALTLSWNYEPWPRSLPAYYELIALSFQAALLPAVHWYHLYLSEAQNMAINVINPNDRKRRIYESALREHLQNPDSSLDETEIPNRVLSTLEQVIPNIPAIVMVLSDDEWHMVGEPSRQANQLRSQLSSIQDDLLQIIADNQEIRINFKDRFGHFYWLFPIQQEQNKTILLAMAPTRVQRNSSAWQTACDITSHAQTLLQASKQSSFWQQQASLDPLTGLLNRRGLSQEAEQRINEAIQSDDTNCCLLFMDVDHFKRVNDQHGHARGDEILQQIARESRHALRHQDLLGRYGGEEFVAVLPNTEPWQALQVAERIRQRIASCKSIQNTGTITLSIGLSALSARTTTLKQLLAEADKAMYQAKQRGRDQTCISTELNDVRLPE